MDCKTANGFGPVDYKLKDTGGCFPDDSGCDCELDCVGLEPTFINAPSEVYYEGGVVTQIDLPVSGLNFASDIDVSDFNIVGAGGASASIVAVQFIDSSNVVLTIDLQPQNGSIDVTYESQCGTTTFTATVAELDWTDLRLGGATLVAGTDVRMRTGMAMSRDAQGMFFTGSNPWSSWVKFESLGFTRGSNKTVEWVFNNPVSAMMIGISSDMTNESANDQYRQSEVNLYTQSSTQMWGLYGNNGTVGGTGNQSSPAAMAAGSTFKAVFTNDGSAGGTFTLYQLPGSNPSDWDNTSTIINTFTIGGSLNPSQTNIFPALIPRSGGSQRFIAVRVS